MTTAPNLARVDEQISRVKISTVLSLLRTLQCCGVGE